jgi:hypothetical protein
MSPIMGATQRGVRFEEPDICQLFIKVMPYKWQQQYPFFQTSTERTTAYTVMGLSMSPIHFLKRLKLVPPECIQYIDNINYWTMSSQYQPLTSVTKNTGRKKPTRVPRTTTFGILQKETGTKPT